MKTIKCCAIIILVFLVQSSFAQEESREMNYEKRKSSIIDSLKSINVDSLIIYKFIPIGYYATIHYNKTDIYSGKSFEQIFLIWRKNGISYALSLDMFTEQLKHYSLIEFDRLRLFYCNNKKTMSQEKIYRSHSYTSPSIYMVLETQLGRNIDKLEFSNRHFLEESNPKYYIKNIKSKQYQYVKLVEKELNKVFNIIFEERKS